MPKGPDYDLLYLIRMLEAIGKIEHYTQNLNTPEDFFFANDQKDFNASLMLLLHLSEQSIKISDATKLKMPQIAWEQIRGFRNRTAHDYIGIDKFMIFEIIKSFLPSLTSGLIILIKNGIKGGVFSKDELLASANSLFYKHVDFKALVE